MAAIQRIILIAMLSGSIVLADEELKEGTTETYAEGNPNGLLSWIFGGLGRPGSKPTEGATTASSEPVEPKTCNCKCGITNVRHRIVGGHETKVNEYGWMAMLLHNNNFYCGGALINSKYVLTAAHCVDGISKSRMSVRLLEHDRTNKNEATPITVGVSDIIMHKNYKSSNFNNDIALVRLSRELEITGLLRPACLPRRGLSYSGKVGVVTGWGKTGEVLPTSNYLQEVKVPIFSNAQCRTESHYGAKRITDNMLCAGYKTGSKDSCQGDSGGPMLVNNEGSHELVGVVSWGEGCARPGYPGVYTRVNRYLTWITKKTTDSCFCTPQ